MNKMENVISPARISNQITEEYYYFLVGLINNGTCSKKVRQIIHHNSSYIFYVSFSECNVKDRRV